MEDKWDIDIKSKKNAPKKGRRAGLGFFNLGIKDNGNQSEKNDIKGYTSPTFQESKAIGWANETLKLSRSKTLNLLDQEQNGNAVKDFDEVAAIPIIPNIEDTTDEEFSDKIAKAPMIGVNRVATYKELENDLLKHTAFASLEEVNLHVLTSHLYPESALSEPDEIWTKDTLLPEVISAMNEERETETIT